MRERKEKMTPSTLTTNLNGSWEIPVAVNDVCGLKPEQHLNLRSLPDYREDVSRLVCEGYL